MSFAERYPNSPFATGIDIGEDHAITWSIAQVSNLALPEGYPWTPDDNGFILMGIHVWHPSKQPEHTENDSFPCGGNVTFARSVSARPGPVWTVESRDPLTIAPSVLCSCGDHGYIREGKWAVA